MSEGGRDFISGGFLLVFCMVIYFSIPYQVDLEETGTLTAASLPAALTIIIGALSAYLLARGIRSTRTAGWNTGEVDEKKGGFVYVAAVGLTLILYVILIPWLGYLLSTGLILGILSYLYGQRIYWQILVLMVVSPPVIYYFFRYTMLVLLPQGSLFN